MSTSFPASKPLSAVRHSAETADSPARASARRRSSRRIVRHSSWFERVSDLPFTLQLKIEAFWDELDFADLGYPVGLALNGASFLIKLGSGAAHLTAAGRKRLSSSWGLLRSSTESQAEQKLEQLKSVQAGGISLGTYLGCILLLISLVNAGYIWTRKRTYQLRNRSELVHSPNAYWVETEAKGPQGLAARFKDLIFGFFNDPPERSRVQQLDVWTPDTNQLYLRIFSLYPPPVSLLWLLLDGSNWWFMLLAIGLTLAQSNLLVYKFSTLMKDKAYVQAEVMHEYDKTFVYPRVFKPTRNVGVMTNEAEMIERPTRRRSSIMPARSNFLDDEHRQEHPQLANVHMNGLGGMRKSKTSSSLATQTHFAEDEDADDSLSLLRNRGRSHGRATGGRHSMAVPQRHRVDSTGTRARQRRESAL